MSYRYTPADDRSALDARIQAAQRATTPETNILHLTHLRTLQASLYGPGAVEPATIVAALETLGVPRYPQAGAEFPTYPQDTLPDFGPGWSESSWGNEGCPAFTHEGKGLHLFADWVDPDQRDETQDGARYSLRFLYGVRPDWQISGWMSDVLAESDDWATIAAKAESIPDTEARGMPEEPRGRPCMFSFDSGPSYFGFALGTTWNGFDNVAVTPAVRDQIAANLKGEDGELEAAELVAMTPGPDGLISLANGWGTQLDAPDTPAPVASLPPATIGFRVSAGAPKDVKISIRYPGNTAPEPAPDFRALLVELREETQDWADALEGEREGLDELLTRIDNALNRQA